MGVASDAGQGATFTVYLARAAAPSVAAPDKPTPVANTRVLVVEDNDEMGEFASTMLQDLGYAITRAIDAQAALTPAGGGRAQL